ncbi:hypothetical protein TcasGA2_TC016413 [Tribolium castaneum]|nr:hypothetical protein TcasGA2_TC016413 [Tribolium castaneum]
MRAIKLTSNPWTKNTTQVDQSSPPSALNTENFPPLKPKAWNANGLHNKLNELHQFTLLNNIDIMLINETHAKPSDTLKIPNYIQYRTDRQTHRGCGTAIYLKQNLKHHQPSQITTENIENTSIVFQTKNGPLQITSAYKPPHKDLISTDLHKLIKTKIPTLIAGNLNCKQRSWNSLNNQNEQTLLEYTYQNNCLILGPTKPTHFGAHSAPDVLDIAVIKDITLAIEIFTINELSSDYNPIIIELNTTSRLTPEIKKITFWPLFSKRVETKTKIKTINTAQELEDETKTRPSQTLYIDQQFSPNYQLINENIYRHIKKISKIIPSLAQTDPPLTPISPEEIKSIISKASNKKSPGPDKIPKKPLKLLPHKTIIKFTNILNAILRLRHLPQSWKHAHIILIPKPGKDPTFPQNYRPINLLSNVSKISERTILNRLTEELNHNQTLPNEQFGFRSHHDTTPQLLRVTERITNNFNNKNKTAMICFDIEKAFDKVWHPGIIAKLCKANLNFRLTEPIMSFLKNRTFQVKSQNQLSNTKKCKAGVPQEAILSPTLFNIFTHDIPKHTQTEIALFADDITIMTTSSK